MKENKRHPTYEEIYDLYVTQNKSCDEVSIYYGISKSTFFKIIKRYGIKKDKKLSLQLRMQTVQEKYGVTNISQCDFVKNKVKDTCLQHYGVKCPTQSEEIKDKIKQTNLNRYGSVAPSGNQMVREKMQKTCYEKYGEYNPSLVPEFKQKRKQTNLDRFGVECNLSLAEHQSRIKDTCIQKYGVPYFCMSKQCSGISKGSYSKINDIVAKKLQNAGIVFEREYALNNYIYDFKIGNLLLEINPTYTHSIDISYHNKKEKISSEYHYKKSKNAIDNNFLCLHIFDWMDIDTEINKILNKEYDGCTVQKRKICVYFFNLKSKILKTNVGEQEVEELLNAGFVRICDDGYDIILRK